MKLVQYNKHSISTVDIDGLVLSTRVSVTTVLSMHWCISTCLWVNHFFKCCMPGQFYHSLQLGVLLSFYAHNWLDPDLLLSGSQKFHSAVARQMHRCSCCPDASTLATLADAGTSYDRRLICDHDINDGQTWALYVYRTGNLRADVYLQNNNNTCHNPDSRVHGANMGSTWVLSAPDGPHVGPMNLAIKECNFLQHLMS